MVDQALGPALNFLTSGSPAEKTAAARLLGSMTEGRQGPAGYLVAEGALPQAAKLLVEGERDCRCVYQYLAGWFWVASAGRPVGSLGLSCMFSRAHHSLITRQAT